MRRRELELSKSINGHLDCLENLLSESEFKGDPGIHGVGDICKHAIQYLRRSLNLNGMRGWVYCLRSVLPKYDLDRIISHSAFIVSDEKLGTVFGEEE